MVVGLEKATLAEVRKAAEALLGPEAMQVVLVGNPEVIEQRARPGLDLPRRASPPTQGACPHGRLNSRMRCPDETTLSDLLAGLLLEERRTEVLTHVEGCRGCQRAVALKLLRPEGRHEEVLRLRLPREAQSLARLSHPDVVTLHDVGSCENGIFLTMDLVVGTTLAEWLRQPHPWPEVLRVFLEAGRGLAAAHAAGLVHRDFKPANVLVGRSGQVRVTDFGLACSTEKPEQTARAPEAPEDDSALSGPLTRTGALLGTPAFMAPEQLQGQGASAHSDQFSFCVALHEALYGPPPLEVPK
jgi:serine/threonine protein kinase